MSLKLDGSLNGGDHLAVRTRAVLIKYAKVDEIDIRGHAYDVLGVAGSSARGRAISTQDAADVSAVSVGVYADVTPGIKLSLCTTRLPFGV